MRICPRRDKVDAEILLDVVLRHCRAFLAYPSRNDDALVLRKDTLVARHLLLELGERVGVLDLDGVCAPLDGPDKNPHCALWRMGMWLRM